MTLRSRIDRLEDQAPPSGLKEEVEALRSTCTPAEIAERYRQEIRDRPISPEAEAQREALRGLHPTQLVTLYAERARG